MTLLSVFIYGWVSVAVGFIGALVATGFIFTYPVRDIMSWISVAAMGGGMVTVLVSGGIWLVTQ